MMTNFRAWYLRDVGRRQVDRLAGTLQTLHPNERVILNCDKQQARRVYSLARSIIGAFSCRRLSTTRSLITRTS